MCIVPLGLVPLLVYVQMCDELDLPPAVAAMSAMMLYRLPKTMCLGEAFAEPSVTGEYVRDKLKGYIIQQMLGQGASREATRLRESAMWKSLSCTPLPCRCTEHALRTSCPQVHRWQTMFCDNRGPLIFQKQVQLQEGFK